MPTYAFEAMQSDGKICRGAVEADNLKAARSLLRIQALVPLTVVAANGGQNGGASASLLQTPLFVSRVFNPTRLAIWTRQLAGLVSSGLTLERALTALSDEAEDEKQRSLVASLRTEVNSGTSFARALSQHPREFSSTYSAVIGAGEQSGHLGLVLERLADDLEERQNLKSKLLAAALYPAIVSCIAIVIVMFLVGYVVPQVAGVFAGTKRALPFLTVAMLGLSSWIRSYWWAFIGVVAVVAGVLRLALKDDKFHEKFDAALLSLPIAGRLLRDYNAARFTSTLSMLAGAGIPILKGLLAASETLSNRAMRADALDALVQVREGASLASALAQKKRFPGMVSMFARLGEQTGKLPLMLQRVAVQLSSEVQRRAMALATILEPLLIVAMGAMVMLIVLAVLLPIIQLNQLVK